MKALQLSLASAILGTALLASGDAKAAGHASGFGDKGQLILSADRLMPLFGYSHISIDAANNTANSVSTSNSEISLLFAHASGSNVNGAVPLLLDVHAVPRIAADFTIINNLTLGLGLGFLFGLGGNQKVTTQNGAVQTQTKVDSPTGTMIGLAPRVGYILPFGEHLAFWPRLGFAFYSVNETQKTVTNNGNTTTTTTNEVTNTAFSLDLDPQLAIIPVEHFFITVGPTLNIPIAGSLSSSQTTGATTTNPVSQDTAILHFGINASIGGWIDIF